MKTKTQVLILLIIFIKIGIINIYAQWQSTHGPLGAETESSILVVGTNVYVIIRGKGTFISKNSGKTWEKYKIGADTVSWVAASGNQMFAKTPDMVNRSLDSGNTWTSVPSFSSYDRIYSFIVKDSLILAQSEFKLLRSSDDGETWAEHSVGSPNWSYKSITQVHNILLASIDGNGIERSTDFGLTWESSDSGLTTNFVQDFLVKDSVVYAGTLVGVYKSTDEGISWINSGINIYRNVYCLILVDSTIFGGTDLGIFKSSNDGKTWESANNGLTHQRYISSLAANDDNIFAVTGDGIFISDNKGKSWFSANLGTKLTQVNSLIVKNSSIFSATEKGIFRLNEDEISWSACNDGLTSYWIYHLISKDTNVIAGTFNGIFLSSNNGKNWNCVDSGGIACFTVSDSLIYAGYKYSGYNSISIKTSKDNGQNWQTLNCNPPDVSYITQCLGVNNSYLFLGGYGLYRLPLDSVNWKKLETDLPSTQFRSLWASDSVILAGTFDNGLYRSTDNGESWNKVLNMEESICPINDIVSNNDTICVATGQGSYISFNAGTNWKNISKNLIDRHPYSSRYNQSLSTSCIVNKDGNIFVGTFEDGVWQSSLDALLVDVKAEGNTELISYNLAQNYPNPFNPSTTIKYQIPEDGMVTLKIYDILGKEVKTLVNEQEPTGRYEVKFDASELATGVYLYRIKVNDFVSVKKMLLVK